MIPDIPYPFAQGTPRSPRYVQLPSGVVLDPLQVLYVARGGGLYFRGPVVDYSAYHAILSDEDRLALVSHLRWYGELEEARGK